MLGASNFRSLLQYRTCLDVDDIESLSHEFLIIVAKEMSEEYFFEYAPARMMARGRKPAALQLPAPGTFSSVVSGDTVAVTSS